MDNDGLQDVLAVGPANPGWAPRAEYVGGRFWRNLDGYQFAEQTKRAGLESLEWTFHEWVQFFKLDLSTKQVSLVEPRVQEADRTTQAFRQLDPDGTGLHPLRDGTHTDFNTTPAAPRLLPSANATNETGR